MKTCSKCGVAKSLDDFHKWKNARDGHRRQCKLCTNADNSERHHRTKRPTKECSDCGSEMRLSKRRYCGKCSSIRAKATLELAKERLRKDYPEKPCEICGNLFEPFHEGDKYCSVFCRNKARGPRKFRSWDPDKKRNYMLNYTYGLSQDQYEDMLAEQGGGCAICGKTPEEEGRNLAVDHSHTTGEIFGILCASCNKVLVGHVREPILFAKAADYLSKGSGLFVPTDKIKPKRRRRKRKTV